MFVVLVCIPNLIVHLYVALENLLMIFRIDYMGGLCMNRSLRLC
jgi:hypothetical protein